MLGKFFGEVKGIFNMITICDMIISTLCVIFGIICFSIQSMNVILVTVVTGLILLGNGVSSIFSYLKRGGIVLFNYNLIFGILLSIVGIIAMFLNYSLAIGLAVYLIIVGVQKIFYGIEFKKFNESSWLVTLATGVLLIVIAMILFFTSKDNIVVVTGITLLGYGILNFVNTILLRRRSNYFIA